MIILVKTVCGIISALAFGLAIATVLYSFYHKEYGIGTVGSVFLTIVGVLFFGIALYTQNIK